PRTGECTHILGSQVPTGTVLWTITRSTPCKSAAVSTDETKPDCHGIHTCKTCARTLMGFMSRRTTVEDEASTSATAVPTSPAPRTTCDTSASIDFGSIVDYHSGSRRPSLQARAQQRRTQPLAAGQS